MPYNDILDLGVCVKIGHIIRHNKYSENAKSCKALVIIYINEFRGCQKLILFAFS